MMKYIYSIYIFTKASQGRSQASMHPVTFCFNHSFAGTSSISGLLAHVATFLNTSTAGKCIKCLPTNRSQFAAASIPRKYF